jgi:hypothetical protein
MRTAGLWVFGAVALLALALGSRADAGSMTMVDVAEQLYRQATPESFDRQCKRSGAKLEVTGERHACTKPKQTTIVEFGGEAPNTATVYRKGLHQGVVGQLERKLGTASSVKTLGAMTMHFWFTKKANVSVGFQRSTESRSTMVSYRSPR